MGSLPNDMYVAHVLRPGICRKLAEHFGRMQSSTGFLPIAANQLLARFNHCGAVKEKKAATRYVKPVALKELFIHVIETQACS